MGRAAPNRSGTVHSAARQRCSKKQSMTSARPKRPTSLSSARSGSRRALSSTSRARAELCSPRVKDFGGSPAMKRGRFHLFLPAHVVGRPIGGIDLRLGPKRGIRRVLPSRHQGASSSPDQAVGLQKTSAEYVVRFTVARDREAQAWLRASPDKKRLGRKLRVSPRPRAHPGMQPMWPVRTLSRPSSCPTGCKSA